MTDDDLGEEDISPITVAKLLLFLVWWFSGIGVGTAFMSPGVIGSGISPNLLLIIILAFFSSGLLIVVLVPEPEKFADDAETGHGETREAP